MLSGAELLKNNWFCNVFADSGGGIFEKQLVLLLCLESPGAELLKNYWCCNVFGDSGGGIVENQLVL